jgi:hypothetical protein
MNFFLFVALTLISAKALAIGCDCEVRVYSPLTASHRMQPNKLRTYELEEYSSYSLKNQRQCRTNCLERFQKEMPTNKLKALLLMYTQSLISENVIGFNCTGLTTLKYPVKVKVTLGDMALGSVADFFQVVNHEEVCF